MFPAGPMGHREGNGHPEARPSGMGHQGQQPTAYLSWCPGQTDRWTHRQVGGCGEPQTQISPSANPQTCLLGTEGSGERQSESGPGQGLPSGGWPAVCDPKRGVGEPRQQTQLHAPGWSPWSSGSRVSPADAAALRALPGQPSPAWPRPPAAPGLVPCLEPGGAGPTAGEARQVPSLHHSVQP